MAVFDRALHIDPNDRTLVVSAASTYFCILATNGLLRPFREAIGVDAGREGLPWLFTWTFVVMLAAVPLYGAVATHVGRKRLIPIVYRFFSVCLLCFALGWKHPFVTSWIGTVFFVWVSVFNLFAVSVFWSLLADVLRSKQAERNFAVIAFGGSAGAIVGPLVAGAASLAWDATLLPLLGVVFLEGALLGVRRVRRYADQTDERRDADALGGSILAGLTHVARNPYLLQICAVLLLSTFVATVLYFQQAELVGQFSADRSERTAVFSAMNLAVNTLALFGQLFVGGRIIARFGVGRGLLVLPVLCGAGLAALVASPTFAVIAVVQVLRRAINYALAKPAREVLFTVTTPEDRYKAKGVIDTVVYRGGDAAGAWMTAGIQAFALGIAGVALAAIPLCVAWAWSARSLGRHYQRVRDTQSERDGLLPVDRSGSSRPEPAAVSVSGQPTPHQSRGH